VVSNVITRPTAGEDVFRPVVPRDVRKLHERYLDDAKLTLDEIPALSGRAAS
jgi:hypothetical protein